MCDATAETGSYCKNAEAGGIREWTGRIAERGDYGGVQEVSGQFRQQVKTEGAQRDTNDQRVRAAVTLFAKQLGLMD